MVDTSVIDHYHTKPSLNHKFCIIKEYKMLVNLKLRLTAAVSVVDQLKLKSKALIIVAILQMIKLYLCIMTDVV